MKKLILLLLALNINSCNPKTINASKDTNLAAARIELRSISIALEIYRKEHQVDPENLSHLRDSKIFNLEMWEYTPNDPNCLVKSKSMISDKILYLKRDGEIAETRNKTSE